MASHQTPRNLQVPSRRDVGSPARRGLARHGGTDRDGGAAPPVVTDLHRIRWSGSGGIGPVAEGDIAADF